MARRVANIFAPQVVPRNVETEVEPRGVTVVEGMEGKGITANSRTEVVIVWANSGGGASTTTINQQVTVTKTVTAGAGGAVETLPASGGQGATTTIKEGQTATIPGKGASHTVKVGGPGGLTFQPDQLNNVPMGDTVVFEFLAQNHTVTQSPFDTPCKAMPGGMDSGFLGNPNNTVSPPPQVAMQVMTTKPLWFYCRQKGHCGKGMVFSINPSAEKTHAMFQGLAIAQNGTGSASPITGGQPGAAPPAQAPQETPGSSQGGSGATPGKGTVGADGSCLCVAACNAGAFPAAQAQGVGSFGGVGGALPIMGSMR
ncbi:hypothetical protein QQS21_011319 [Conoideocrella luteorostrata]|uniref:Cupredoxin n=1 Tax=Conoideocrella luteorostrata TaxID=1105319 RepID=A0AAJ0CHW7_9HYPO|nr:hypothetical protein QQS21_011319 [Conoideocrella luteorostrata]